MGDVRFFSYIVHIITQKSKSTVVKTTFYRNFTRYQGLQYYEIIKSASAL